MMIEVNSEAQDLIVETIQSRVGDGLSEDDAWMLFVNTIGFATSFSIKKLSGGGSWDPERFESEVFGVLRSMSEVDSSNIKTWQLWVRAPMIFPLFGPDRGVNFHIGTLAKRISDCGRNKIWEMFQETAKIVIEILVD